MSEQATNNERYSRQKDIVPPDRIAGCKAMAIGVGAIGRQVSLQLTAIGIPWLQLIDDDNVEISNLASQGYLQKDHGRPKVDATSELCRDINHNLEIHVTFERFRRRMPIGNIVFCCVDSINTRKLIWEAVKDKVNCFIDGRMSAEVLRILTACNFESRKYYPSTLFRAEEAFVGPCTAKTTIYCANIAAGLMLSQFTKYLRQLPIDFDIQLNLLASELSVDEAISYFKRALSIAPNYADAHYRLGRSLTEQGNLDKAFEHFNKSLQLNPNNPVIHFDMSQFFALQGKYDFAIEHLNKVIKINPGMAVAYQKLGAIYRNQGKFAMVISNWKEFLKLKPNSPCILNDLAWILAASEDKSIQNPSQAVEYAERASKLTKHKEPAVLDTLAVTYAAAGDFDKAIETAQKAVGFATSAGNKELTSQIKNRLELYKAGNPYSEP